MNVFDKVIVKSFDGFNIQYGISIGSDNCLVIKTGKDASIYGENENQPDLYVKLTQRIRKEFGYTVIVITNPSLDTRNNPLDTDFETIYELDVKISKMFFLGYSSGANYFGWYADKYNPEKVCLMNPILWLNFHKINRMVERATFNVKLLIGEWDESFNYMALIMDSPNLKTEVLYNQDHHVETGLFIEKVIEFLKE